MATIQVKDANGTTKYYDVLETGSSSEPHQPIVPDYRIPYAINQIFNDDAVTVSVREKAKSLIKFGRNEDLDVGTSETIWNVGGDETYQTGNTIDRIVSTNAGDTQDVVVEGHTLSGSDFTFVTQTATLNGTTAVTLATPLARANILYNNGSTNFAGTVTVYVNGGTTHLSSGTSGANQSLKCATTISSQDYWIITGLDINVEGSASANVDFSLQIRESGKVFRSRFTASTNNTGRFINFAQPIIVKPNSDVRVKGLSSVNNTVANATIFGYLAIIT